ncbi:hypothetical protein EYZ11_006113 [Aspergillus tanneri]|uniref:Uncharacterized protein n=1 Tax=Aspergillus tanneri TaxID=1220188 RepID=A0A4S3JGA7_9EURO|nr:hypothetical protein EYZ11_006113 [Aspergillus tanneri]
MKRVHELAYRTIDMDEAAPDAA